jgi:hypothetical protein
MTPRVNRSWVGAYLVRWRKIANAQAALQAVDRIAEAIAAAD